MVGTPDHSDQKGLRGNQSTQGAAACRCHSCLVASFPGPFETLEDGPGNEAGYRITKWHVSEMKAVSTQ